MSGIYGGSRTLHALAVEGYAPGFFRYVDRGGRPLPATIAVLLCGLLAYISIDATGQVVFDWLVALSGLAALFTWGSICLAHIRFRAAWAHNGRTVEEIPFRAAFGVWGSWAGLILIFLVLVAQFYTAMINLEDGSLGTAEGFFEAYLALPLVLLFWAAGYLWKGKGFLKVSQIDISSGMREVDWDYINEKRARQKAYPAWKRALVFLF